MPNGISIAYTSTDATLVLGSPQELLPTALLYDPHNALTTRCAILGMAVMAASLVLFQL